MCVRNGVMVVLYPGRDNAHQGQSAPASSHVLYWMNKSASDACRGDPSRGQWQLGNCGKKDKEGRIIGAECSGTALKLEEPCFEMCNDLRDDPGRNYKGVVRSYVAYN